jgi:hypothetical protein
MAKTTFDGPVRSLNGFLGTGPKMIQAITGTVADSATDINKYQGKVLTIGNASTTFNLPAIVATADSASSGPGSDPNSANNVGLEYEFLVTANLTGGNTFVLNAVTAFAASLDTLTLDATTRGGLGGAHIKCRAVAGLTWQIEAQLIGNGAFVTPFS